MEVVFEMHEFVNNGSMHREDRNKQGVLGGVLGKCARTPRPGKRRCVFFEMNESLNNGSMHRDDRNKQGLLFSWLSSLGLSDQIPLLLWVP